MFALFNSGLCVNVIVVLYFLRMIAANSHVAYLKLKFSMLSIKIVFSVERYSNILSKVRNFSLFSDDRHLCFVCQKVNGENKNCNLIY